MVRLFTDIMLKIETCPLFLSTWPTDIGKNYCSCVVSKPVIWNTLFVNAVHQILGLDGLEFQSLYHFTIGSPVLDKRIMSLPAYPGPDIDA